MDQLHYKSATELASLIRRKKVSALELLDHFLARVEKYNPTLNAIIWMDRDKARKRAKAADAALKKGKRFGPLHGVPMTIKESFQVAGSPTTWGVPGLKDNVTAETAVSAQRMIDAGVTLFGKMQRAGHACGLAELQSDLRHHRTIRGTRVARRAVRPAARRLRSLPASPASTPAATSAPRSAIRRTTAACSATSRPTGSSRCATIPCPARSRRPTSRRSGPSPARRRTSRRRSTSWPGPTPTTADT